MGIFTMGPPTSLMVELKLVYQINTFVESGTYLGGTASWAASVFDRVITMEASQELYEKTKTRYASLTNVEFLCGDSRSVLPQVIQSLNFPALFWLDSHWSGEGTHGRNDECPVLEEIRLINNSRHANFLFIDDARLFMSPPPEPHDWTQWPSIEEVIYALQADGRRYHLVIMDDVLIAVPNEAKDCLTKFCRRVNTNLWEEYVDRQAALSLSGSRLVTAGFRLMGKSVLRKVRRRYYGN